MDKIVLKFPNWQQIASSGHTGSFLCHGVKGKNVRAWKKSLQTDSYGQCLQESACEQACGLLQTSCSADLCGHSQAYRTLQTFTKNWAELYVPLQQFQNFLGNLTNLYKTLHIATNNLAQLYKFLQIVTNSKKKIAEFCINQRMFV